MLPWILLDTAPIAGSDGKSTGAELRLMRRGTEFSIKLGQNELMNSRLSGSEEALATLVFEKLALGRQNAAHHKAASPQTVILIGGLGMGFTLRAALNSWGPLATVIVAELVPAVVAWARGPMASVFADSLDDPRVSLHQGDVSAMIRSGKQRFDAILLDVDNGPEGLTQTANDALYDMAGLSAAHSALRPGGVLAVWSSGPDPRFTQRLRKAGFSVDEVKIRANGKRGGARHMIWLATRFQTQR